MSCITSAVSSSSNGGTDSNSGGKVTGSGAGGYDMPNESDETFSDYVKRVDPELYNEMFNNYNDLSGN